MADTSSSHDDALRFIRANMPAVPVPSLPGICLHTASPATGLRRLGGGRTGSGAAPYWAYPWAGGLALALYLRDRPDIVAERRVLDLGAGSGLVAVAAARAGARAVMAAEIDRHALAALELNALANSADIIVIDRDLTKGPPPDVDVVLVGDLFYEARLARRVTAFLDRCLAAGIAVLIGDPGRAHLPRARLRLLAEYQVADVGDSGGTACGRSCVFSFVPHGA